MFKKIKKYKFLLVFFLILSLGFFLRAFKFSDWMHYQLDQARDFRVIHSAVKYGVGELPLQGPKAAGNVEIKSETGEYDDTTTLRLGPLFYYLEFVSALIFGDTPAGSIILILIFSFLTIPLFYIFSREFFDRKISLILMTIFSVSIFFVTYSRFGWNPNLMPFFMLLSMFCLLQMTRKDFKIKGLEDFYIYFSSSRGLSLENSYNKGWWLVLLAVSMAFLTNMHFLAFTVAPTITVIYLIFTRPKIAFKFWIFAILIFIFLNTPLIINDIKTKGENTKAFISAILKKSGKTNNSNSTEEDLKKGNHNFLEKLVKNGGEHTRYFWLILTGDQRAELPQISDNDLKCDKNCRDGLWRGGLALIFMFLSLFSAVYFYWKNTDFDKNNFLKLCAVWLVINFGAYIPLAYDLAPRFFLLNSPLILILWGMNLKFVTEFNFKNLKWKKILIILFWLISGVFIIFNLFFTLNYFNELSQASKNSKLDIKTDFILKEKNRVTLRQMEEIVDFIEEKYKQNNFPVFLDGQAEFKRAFWERLDFREIPRGVLARDFKPLYREGNYFAIARTQTEKNVYLKPFLKGLDLIEEKTFGTLTIYVFKPKEEFITDENAVIEIQDMRKDPEFSSSAQVRYLWRQVFE